MLSALEPKFPRLKSTSRARRKPSRSISEYPHYHDLAEYSILDSVVHQALWYSSGANAGHAAQHGGGGMLATFSPLLIGELVILPARAAELTTERPPLHVLAWLLLTFYNYLANSRISTPQELRPRQRHCNSRASSPYIMQHPNGSPVSDMSNHPTLASEADRRSDGLPSSGHEGNGALILDISCSSSASTLCSTDGNDKECKQSCATSTFSTTDFTPADATTDVELGVTPTNAATGSKEWTEEEIKSVLDIRDCVTGWARILALTVSISLNIYFLVQLGYTEGNSLPAKFTVALPFATIWVFWVIGRVLLYAFGGLPTDYEDSMAVEGIASWPCAWKDSKGWVKEVCRERRWKPMPETTLYKVVGLMLMVLLMTVCLVIGFFALGPRFDRGLY